MLRFGKKQKPSLQEFGAAVARKLLSLITLCSVNLALTACVQNTDGSLQVTYPYQKEARMNARNGLSELREGETGSAYIKLKLALRQAPNDALILDSMGYYMEKTGDMDLANRYFFKAVTVAPASGAIRSNYGAFLCRNGYSEEGIVYFLQAANIPHYNAVAKAYADARHCAEGLGDKAESAYYIKLINESFSQQKRKNGH